jgi:hypothetical protein
MISSESRVHFQDHAPRMAHSLVRKALQHAATIRAAM